MTTHHLARMELLVASTQGSADITPATREHVNICNDCWQSYNKLRWGIARTTQDVDELAAFLGPSYEEGKDSSWLLAQSCTAQSRVTASQVAEFYSSADMYVYNLTIWHASGQRPRYVERVDNFLFKSEIRSVIDLGAGVGTDSLAFSHLGIRVTAVEYDTLASRFLKWRAAKRDLKIVHLQPEDPLPEDGYDLLWAMDVLEHLVDPISVLAPYLKKCKFFLFDTEHDGRAGGRQPFHFRHDYDKLHEQLLDLHFVRRDAKISNLQMSLYEREH